ncbi:MULTISPECIES: Glu-tRNA(Gln) amidotransferase subunit GatE [Acidiplasma]|jgi:glutamyl-tRNA(Gln) amidotransferase subunit E|uniref:Glutamyl-tRNA(Gln) amidotransferase subunit E n=3 Tax=Acidiplasma TaxID=507753 RepID=A0A0N8VKY6_9ARCH|nr:MULTISPECIES: Glu-tRNA(Gln) amidotransferase subunit GatE [Acidiplasma]KQB34160.1 glutamyl-tRNA amidotransferase [Acidiplasma aeolicum]KQB35028.1 glutamyl-tRNA amidotransferase [Acidiplasma cupricumulans]WMT55643.1 MAG: Glu-tRNA(Gln) amidotransferase subunit GatE [Acidiplasma sp.]
MKIGLEIHFQLKGVKLFCSCSTEGEKSNYLFKRKMTPTMSEMGHIDRAARYENIRNRDFNYYTSTNSCLVDADEEPPHMPDDSNINTAIIVSMALHCKIVDYVSFMRKIVIDGSNTSGFQRTGIVGLNGYVETSQGRVRISTVTLEEDASRKISESGKNAFYSLDRLGIPLIEISTEPDIKDENHAIETARKIGFIVMSTGKFRGEVDSIRQDVNFSMGYGRVEIKGVSKLSLIKDTIKYEIQRQKSLADISGIIKARGGTEITDFMDITHILKDTDSKIIKAGLNKNKKVFCAKINNARGLLKNGNYRLGRELADVAKNMGIGGMMHSDELPGYGLTDNDVNNINNFMGIENNDAIIMVITDPEIITAFKSELDERLKNLMSMNLAETRAATEDGETRFLRPLSGGERMYPETDIGLIEIPLKRLNSLEGLVPESMEDALNNLKNNYGFSQTEAMGIINNNLYGDFKDYIKVLNEPKIISRIILQKLPEYEKKYNKKLSGDELMEIFTMANENKWGRDSVEKALELYVSGKYPLKILANAEELKPLDAGRLREIIIELMRTQEITEKNLIYLLKNKTKSSFDARDAIKIFENIKNNS